MTHDRRTRAACPAPSPRTPTRAAALVAAAGLLAACSGGADDASGAVADDGAVVDGSAPSAESLEALPAADPAAAEEATFPTVPGETEEVTVPTIELPAESGVDVELAGTGATVREGDRVEIHYELRSLATGSLVESTRTDGDPRLVQVGEAMVPEVLEAALLGQQVGARLTVTYEQGLADLPVELDPDHAYVLDVEIVSVS